MDMLGEATYNVCRITPEMALEAYRSTGRKPARGLFRDPQTGLACPAGAVAEYARRQGLGALTLRTDYAHGFSYGFDGVPYGDADYQIVDVFASGRDRFDEGYGDGKACWEAIEREGLEVSPDYPPVPSEDNAEAPIGPRAKAGVG